MLSVRELSLTDIPSLVDYWTSLSPQELHVMGADPALLPSKSDFTAALTDQFDSPYETKKSYCLIWENEGNAIGHCNVNMIRYGDHAFMHLHMWTRQLRGSGLGAQLVTMSLPYFFRNLKLDHLYCQPKSDNTAPGRVLEKAGFQFVKEYVTTPGAINFEQSVHLWEIKRADVAQLVSL